MIKIKKIANLLTLIVTISGLITFSNCGSGDPTPAKTESQRVTDLLVTSPAWKIQRAAVDGIDESSLFKNLTITFTTNRFSTTNGGSVWPAIGTWAFTDDTAKSFKRDDGTVVSVDNITDSELGLSLTWNKTTFAGGRTGSISGKNVFTLGK